MAGFQQAANALTGAYGTVAGKVGIYNELVGKNKEQREQLAKQNEELDKKNKELDSKNKELEKKNNLIETRNFELNASLENYLNQSQQMDNLKTRIYSIRKARASRDIMLDVVYGENPTESPNRKFIKELFKQEINKGGK